MKSLLPLIILLAGLPCSAAVDPFGTEGNKWTMDVLSKKPYTLEIRYGETGTPLPKNQVPFIIGSTSIITSDFLNQSHKIDAAISEKDEGRVAIADYAEVIYRAEREKKDFSIQISLSVTVGGNKTIITKLTIPENEWVAIGEMSRESSDSGKRYFYAAIRIHKRSPPSNDKPNGAEQNGINE